MNNTRYEIYFDNHKITETTSELAAVTAALRAVYPIDGPLLEIRRVTERDVDKRKLQISSAVRALSYAMHGNNIPNPQTVGNPVLTLGAGTAPDPLAEPAECANPATEEADAEETETDDWKSVEGDWDNGDIADDPNADADDDD